MTVDAILLNEDVQKTILCLLAFLAVLATYKTVKLVLVIRKDK